MPTLLPARALLQALPPEGATSFSLSPLGSVHRASPLTDTADAVRRNRASIRPRPVDEPNPLGAAFCPSRSVVPPPPFPPPAGQLPPESDGGGGGTPGVLPPDRCREVWDALRVKHGALKSRPNLLQGACGTQLLPQFDRAGLPMLLSGFVQVLSATFIACIAH